MSNPTPGPRPAADLPAGEGSTGPGDTAEPAHQAAGVHPKLDEREQAEVEERTAASAQIVYGAIQKEGEEELERPSSALAWSGLAAGLSMGFSLVAEALLHSSLPDASWRPLLAKLGYSIGFVIVILGRQQLFTENTLTPILPLLTRRNRATLRNVLRLWGIVLSTNLLGTLLFAWVLGHTPLFDGEVRQTMTTIAQDALHGDFWSTMLRGIFAGWLIALMVWLLPAAEMARLWVIIIITYLVGLAGLSHIVAGSTEMFYLATTGAAAWGDVIVGYILPTLLGNIVGGVALVAALNYAQVVSGKE